jgi:hypothetical protein
MIKIASIWDVWLPSVQEYGIHWRFLRRHFNVSMVYMTPITGAGEEITRDSHDGSDTIIEYETLQSVIEANPEMTPVILDENSPNPLRTFVHPENALYITGRTGLSPIDVLGNEVQSVYIESASGESSPMLHPHQAMCIVLYDRLRKSWQ